MSRLPFELMLALRYLRPRRTFVSVITLISVLGVALGVAVLIIVISVMSGFDQELREKVLGFNTHLKVLQRDRTMENYAQVAGIVAANPSVRGTSPFVMGQVLVETQPEGEQAIVGAPWVRGVDAETEGKVSSLPNSVILGRFDLSGRGLVVGSEFAHNLRLKVGDKLAVYSPRDLERMRKNRGKEGEEAILPEDYEVRGIFDAGYFEYNLNVIVTSLENAQDLYGLDNSVHGLLVMLQDPYKAGEIRAKLGEALGPEFNIRTWMEDSSVMLAVMVEKNVMLYILFFIVIVAAFGITCTLITFVVQKTREIGLLKALGASSRQVMWIFMCQSMVVSVLGILAGTGAGMLALAYRNEFLFAMRSVTGLELFPASVYNFSELPALIVTGDIAIICGGSFVICLLAAAFPVWHASRLKPVEALRYE